MNPFVAPVHCEVCGGEAMATPSMAARQWYGSRLVHRDPFVCREVLAEKARKKALEKIAIAERVVTMFPVGTSENEQTLANTVSDLVRGTPIVDLDLRYY